MLNVHLNDAIGELALEPLSSTIEVSDLPVGGKSLEDAQCARLREHFTDGEAFIVENFWPSLSVLREVAHAGRSVSILSGTSEIFRYQPNGGSTPTQWTMDDESILITYPWHLLSINSELLRNLTAFRINGDVSSGVTIDGDLSLGEGSILLPGVFIEGRVVIGRDCRIGPNCYIRGETSIHDGCRVGHAVEVKNSILMENVSVGHLSYLGDSIVGTGSNIGAGTITANYRHDGKTHRSMVNDQLIDTGRTKLGTVIGAEARLGINTSIYPGRKVWPRRFTLPGEIVDRDVC